MVHTSRFKIRYVCTLHMHCTVHIAYVVCIVLYMKWSPFPIAVAVKMSILHCCLFSSLGRQKFMRLLQKLKRGVTHWFLFALLHYHKKWATYTEVRNLSVLMEERKPGKIYGDMTFMVPENNFDWFEHASWACLQFKLIAGQPRVLHHDVMR